VKVISFQKALNGKYNRGAEMKNQHVYKFALKSIDQNGIYYLQCAYMVIMMYPVNWTQPNTASVRPIRGKYGVI
jgi:hypothetical protein